MAKEIKDIGVEDFDALFQAFKSDDVATGQRIIEKHNMHQNTTVRVGEGFSYLKPYPTGLAAATLG